MDQQEKLKKMDALRRQCDTCKLGNKKITSHSGCDIRKQLIMDKSDLSWDRSDVFLYLDGSCKLYEPKEGVKN